MSESQIRVGEKYEVQIIDKRGSYGVAEIGDFTVYIPYTSKGKKNYIEILYIGSDLPFENVAYAGVVGGLYKENAEPSYYQRRIAEASSDSKKGRFDDFNDSQFEAFKEKLDILINMGEEGYPSSDEEINRRLNEIDTKVRYEEYNKQLNEYLFSPEPQNSIEKTQMDLMSIYVAVMIMLFFFGMIFIFIIF